MLWAASFYPSAWRKRYGEELLATVEDMPTPGWAVVWDVWKGALTMQIHYGRTVSRLAAFSLIGLALAFGASWLIPDIYASEAAMRSSATPESLHQSLREVLARPRLAALIEKHRLYGSERAHMPLEDIIEKMKKNIHVNPIGKDPAKRDLAVGFTYEDGAAARRVTSDLVAALTHAGDYSVLDSASNPSPIYPNRPMFAFTAWLAGALLGVAWAAVKAVKRRQA